MPGHFKDNIPSFLPHRKEMFPFLPEAIGYVFSMHCLVVLGAEVHKSTKWRYLEGG